MYVCNMTPGADTPVGLWNTCSTNIVTFLWMNYAQLSLTRLNYILNLMNHEYYSKPERFPMLLGALSKMSWIVSNGKESWK